jgi:hypothetical protein
MATSGAGAARPARRQTMSDHLPRRRDGLSWSACALLVAVLALLLVIIGVVM